MELLNAKETADLSASARQVRERLSRDKLPSHEDSLHLMLYTCQEQVQRQFSLSECV